MHRAGDGSFGFRATKPGEPLLPPGNTPSVTGRRKRPAEKEKGGLPRPLVALPVLIATS